MNQEEQNEKILENLSVLSEELDRAGLSGSNLAASIEEQKKAIESQIAVTKDAANAQEKLNNFQKETLDTEKKHKQAVNSLTASYEESKKAFTNLMGAVLDSERTYKKYTSVVQGAGSAAGKLAESFGFLGKGTQIAIKGLTFLGEKALEQADNVVNANDSLRKMGAAGAFTSEEFLKLAHNSGVTSKNLDLLVKPIENLESTLMGLGTTAGEGIESFSQITAITSEQRKEFRRLGLSQDELIESQAAYLELQNATGSRMRRTGETEEQRVKRLQKESLDYTKNLSELSALTGKDVDVLKKEQEAAQSEAELQIQNLQDDQEIERLRQAGKLEEARALEKEKDVRNQLVGEINSTYRDEDLNKGLREMITTGGAVFSEEGAALERQLSLIGKSYEDYQAGIEAGDESVIAQFKEDINRATLKAAEQVGDAGQLGGEEVRKAFGLTSERMVVAGRRAGIDEEEARREANERRRRAAEEGYDPTMDARAQLTELEISASVALDDLLMKVNPLVGGFGAATLAAGAAAAALTGLAASAAFRGMGGMAGMGGRLAGAAGGAKGAVASAAGGAKALGGKMLGAKVSGLSGTALKIGGGAGAIGALVGVAESIKEGQERREDIEARREAGLISEEEAESAQSVSSARTSGQSVGVAAGALAGGAKGAAMGAVLGPIGATVGGLIGAGLGAWAGKTGGAMIGEAIGEQFGDAVEKRDFSQEMEQSSAKLEVLRATGASEEEISYLEQKIQLQESLQEAEEASDFGAMKRLLLEEELLDARQSGDQAKIDQLEKQIELEDQLEKQTKELTQLEDTLARAKEAGVGQEHLDKLQAQIDAKKEDVDATKEQTQAIEDQKKAEKEAQEQEERRKELKEKIKKLEAEKEEAGPDETFLGFTVDAEARARNDELEAAKAELEELGGSPEQTSDTAKDTAGGTDTSEGSEPPKSGDDIAQGDSSADKTTGPNDSSADKTTGKKYDNEAIAMKMAQTAENWPRSLAKEAVIDNGDGTYSILENNPANKDSISELVRSGAKEKLKGAAKGGVFSGPETGFPVELHGTELVAPLDPNSILMELAQTSSTDTGGEGAGDTASDPAETLERNVDVTMEMMQMLSSKLDIMISELETGNEVSDRILKQSY
jgi:hypothetical protein